MYSKEVTIVNPSGLHARPASDFVARAEEFECEITIGRPGEDEVDAKSIVMLLTLGLCQGEKAVLTAEGSDAQAAVDALAELVAGGFGEL